MIPENENLPLSRNEKIFFTIIGIVGVGLIIIWWFDPFGWFSPTETKKSQPLPSAAPSAAPQVDREAIDRISTLVGNLTDITTSNMLEVSQLISSNQIVMSEKLQNFTSEMTSNNTTIRAEIPDIVERSVAEKLAKAMEPFQRLLTNPPPAAPTVITQPVVTPPSATVTNPPPPIVAATPQPQPVTAAAPATGITNNNMTVINLPPSQPQPQPVVLTSTSAPPTVLFQNNNTIVVGSPSQPGQSATNAPPPPYWLRNLW